MKQIKYKIIVWSFFLFLLNSVVISQNNIKVNTSNSLDMFMQQFINNGKNNENIKAWRIQIITTDNRREMEQAKDKFKTMYPDISMDWKHISPYYQVRIGHYENKNKLMPFLLELKKTFPAATPIYDTVSKRSLVHN